jgi:hypothetical protein
MGDSAAWQIGSAAVLSAVRELAADGKSMVIELTRGARRGQIELQHGEIIVARAGRLAGTEAFNHLLLWSADAKLQTRANPVSSPATQMALSVDSLIESGLKFVEALDGLEPFLGGPRATFDPAPRKLAEAAAKLPTQVRRFAERIEPNTTLIALIEASPFSPIDTIKVCYRLCELGVIKKREPAPARPVAARPAAVARAIVAPSPPVEEPTTKRPRVAPAPPPVPRAETTGKRPRKDPTGEITSRRTRVKPAPETKSRPKKLDPYAVDLERSAKFARFAPEQLASPANEFDEVEEAFFAGETAHLEPEAVDRFEDLENTATRRKLDRKSLL